MTNSGHKTDIRSHSQQQVVAMSLQTPNIISTKPFTLKKNEMRRVSEPGQEYTDLVKHVSHLKVNQIEKYKTIQEADYD